MDAIGCVYSDVDHRYYNNTLYTHYSSIDIQPGYQPLCGHNQSVSGALPFVRFRHTDTDIVREARQQDFIRWAKAQYPISKLFSNRDRLLRIFGKHSTLDKTLQSSDQIINLFNLVLNADGSTIKQIPFPADLQPCTTTSCFVTAQQSREAQVFARFMAATPKAQTKAKTAVAGGGSTKGHQRLGADQHCGADRGGAGWPQPGRPAEQGDDARLLPQVHRGRVAVLPEPDRQLHPGRRAGERICTLLSAPST